MWRWMHAFRVWLADRKVFLQPENWLEPDPPLRIAGRVTDAEGRPVASLLVRAFAVALKREELIGESSTDAAGRYEITAPADRVGADVVVAVFDSAGVRAAASPVVSGGKRSQSIDVIL